VSAVIGAHANAHTPLPEIALLQFALFLRAHDQGVIDSNPLVGMGGPEPVKSRDRVLSDEITAFWCATKRLGGIFAPVFQLLLLTGQRREEVAALRWDEVDLANAAKTASLITSICRRSAFCALSTKSGLRTVTWSSRQRA
jgi:integrase